MKPTARPWLNVVRPARRRAGAPDPGVVWLHHEGLLLGRILVYLCGEGREVTWLRHQGHDVRGWDPVRRPQTRLFQGCETVIVPRWPPERELETINRASLQIGPPWGRLFFVGSVRSRALPLLHQADDVYVHGRTKQGTTLKSKGDIR